MDERVAALAERQHGVVAARQLAELGMGRPAVRHRVARGRLHPLYCGVFAVGHRALGKNGRWMAAVLACGPGAVSSFRGAAGIWRLLPYFWLEVTVPKRRRGPKEITVHHSPLAPDEVTTENGIPVTTVPRTLLDLAAVLPGRQLEKALNESEVRQHTDPLSLPDLMERHPHQSGIRVLRELLGHLRLGGTITRSELEARFRDFIRLHKLPIPLFNAPILGFECDCAWPAQRLVVELDGHAVHHTRAAFERDRARDRVLIAAGWRVVRITWRQLLHEPEKIAADLRTMLRG
jgi:very-short-patch-repair endonuclease